MNTGNQIVDGTLERAAARWRRLLFLQHTGTIGASVCLVLLGLAAAMLAGWLTEPLAAGAIMAGALLIGSIVWLGSVMVVRGKDPNRPWLSGVLERGQPKLLDRLNTLVSLESRRARPEVAPFYQRIARQAQQILFETPLLKIPLASKRPMAHFLIFLALLVATVVVYQELSPWRRMLEARQARLAAVRPTAKAPPPAPGLELPAPMEMSEKKQAWAEVRFTEPARDLQMTKVDVVPLQIEAAANEPLQKISWTSAVNGKREEPHDLPAPADPRFAVFQPTLYLDELKLSDWDVLSYYAQARTRDTNSAASEIYFIEVRPFREDILKMPGGEGGKAMQCINELSALIGQQQHVIRQTHQHAQSPPESSKVRDQDRKKLAEAEADLGQATEHLYARMSSELENKPIGDALDHLAKAGKWLDSAAKSIRENSLPAGQEQERGALADLVATRKAFQKAVSEHSSEFDETAQETPPVADSKDKLKEMAEFRDEAKAAEDFLKKLLEQQQALANSPNQTTPQARTNLYPRLAEQEKKIETSLKDFRQQHPQVFKPVQPEASATEQSLESARQSLERKNPQSPSQIREAAQKMEKLAEAMKEKSAERQLADAYKLKKEIDRQVQKFSQCQNPGAGGGPSDADVKQAVADTRKALKQLKNVADQSPTREAFGPALRESLNDPNLMSMNLLLGELDQAPTPEERKKPAGEAKERLEKVSKAFEESEPQAMQMAERAAQKTPPLDFDRGLAQLDSLVRQLENKRQGSRDNQAKLGKEALYNLQRALPEKGGSNERGHQLVAQLEEQLKKNESPVDVEILKSVLESLQAYSIEVGGKKDAKPEKPEITGLDPNRLPPAYRGRIEKYFQKLSEK